MSTVDKSYLPCRADHLMEYDMEGELTLYDPQAEVVHVLNATAAAVWRVCDGAHSTEDIARALACRYGLEPEAVAGDVREILAQLHQARLLAAR